MQPFERACARHFPALVDFVEEARPGARTDAALLHLDGCARCRADLEATALTVHGLRLLARAANDVEPPADAWMRLRSRIERRAPSRFLMAARLSGAVLTVGIVAALALPSAVGRGDASGSAGWVNSDAPGTGFDPTPVILAERAFERPSERPNAFVVVHPEPTPRLSDSVPPGRLDGWQPEPPASEPAVLDAPLTRRYGTR